MASLLAFGPRPLPPPLPRRSKPPNPLFPSILPARTRGDLLAVKSGFASHLLPDLDTAAQEIFGRVEGVVFTLADAVASSSAADPAALLEESKKNSDWLSGIANYMETVLKILKGGLSAVHVPYAYGFAIILLTVLVKAATFPLTKKQVESAMAMRSLQPQVKAVQQRYAGDQERIQLETARLYKLAGINPLAGCLPTLATIPVWIGLYRALSNVADEGLLTEGFFWIPSLSGPTTIAARQSGSGTSWLFPFVDGQPPLGWSDTLAYLVLPLLLVVSQYISAQIMQPPQNNDQSQQNSQVVTKLLPLMIGYFALSVPSGLSLYWFTNNILSTAQQIWLQKLGGAKNPVLQFTDSTSWDESSNIPKSISNIEKPIVEGETGKINSGQEVKANSGLRPGERFKQIKEQEQRRRKQMEEAKRRAEEEEKNSAAEEPVDSQLISSKNNPELELGDDTDERDSGNSQKRVLLSTTNNGGVGVNVGPAVNGEESSHRKVQKEEVTEINAATSNPTTNGTINREEGEPERDES